MIKSLMRKHKQINNLFSDNISFKEASIIEHLVERRKQMQQLNTFYDGGNASQYLNATYDNLQHR